LKLLVTGGAGYIGSHAAHQLIDEGDQVVVLDNLYSGHRWAVPEQARFVEGNVGDTALVEQVLRDEGIEAVLHFAAHVEVGESVEQPAKYYRNNTVASLGLFEACARAGVERVIFSSTAAVYGEPAGEPASEPAGELGSGSGSGSGYGNGNGNGNGANGALSETSPLRPMNPYGASKLMSEQMLADLGRASNGRLRYVILRYFNAAGARRDLRVGQSTPRATHLVKIAAETALGLRDSLTVFGTDYPTVDGTCLRDYIHVEDLVQAHCDALKYLESGGHSEIFNVGYGHASSVLEVIAAMERVSGREIRVFKGPRRAGDPSIVLSDNQKIRRVLGWNPRFDDLDLICRTAFEWEKILHERKKVTNADKRTHAIINR
jgi:UDP-glucose 4-epimerase